MEDLKDSPLDEAFHAPVDEDGLAAIEEEPLSLDEQGVLYNGHLTRNVTIGTHRVVLRTLRIGEELEAALVADRYKDTVEAGRALATALVAASIQSVDGQPLIREALSAQDLGIEAKFNFVLNNWYWPSIQKLYAEYGELVSKLRDTFEAVGKG